MAESGKTTYPRIPESNWWTLRDQMAKSLPSTVSVSYLKSLLQLTSEDSARNLISPLQKLGLIDSEGKPTDRANDWRSETRYAQACQQMLEDAYPTELRDLHSGKNINRNAVEEWFKYTAKLGDKAAQASAAMYILLNEATPKSSTEYQKARTTKPKNGSKAASKPKETKKALPEPLKEAETPNSQVVVPEANPKSEVENWFSLHIDLQIHISPEASAEQIDQIFASMAKHIMTMKQPIAGNI